MELLDKVFRDERELVADSDSLLSHLVVQLSDHWVHHHVFVERVGNVLLRSLFVIAFVEDLAEAVPPPTKLFR